MYMGKLAERTKKAPDRARDGYEDAPADIADAMKTGTRLPFDFLPSPTELAKAEVKIVTTIRLDHDVVAWFKSFGGGYQTKINAVLKAYKAVHEKKT
jgi:uncharacterized protein (DUF4415 family)